MKTMKRYTGLYYALIALFFVVSITIYFTHTTLLLEMPWIHWGAIALAIFFILTPKGSKRLVSPQAEQQPLPRQQWLIKILNLQISLFLIYFSITQFNQYFAIEGQAPKSLLTDSLNGLLFHFGLFPWALIAIFAVGFGTIAYLKNQDAYLSQISLGFLKKRHETLEVIVKTTARAATIGAVAITFVLLTFILASIISNIQALTKLTGFTAASMGAAFLMLFLTMRRNNSHFLTTINQQRPLLGVLLLVLIWAIVLMLLSIIVTYTGVGDSDIPALLMRIFNKGWLLHWQLFSELWWLMLTPITAVFIARFSYGYSIRAIIIATLALPFMIMLLLQFNAISPNPLNFNNVPLWLVQLAGALGFLSLVGLLYDTNNKPLTVLTYLPKLGNEKLRNEEIYQQRLKRLCGVMFYLFIPAGFFVTSLFMSLIIIPMLGVIVMTYWQTCRTLRQD